MSYSSVCQRASALYLLADRPFQMRADRCRELLNGIFRDVLHTPITLSPEQVRCQRRIGDAGSGGFCEFRLNVLRTQEYPEGFEFVLSEAGNDQGWRLIALLGRSTGTTSGTVRRFDAP